MPSHFLHRSDGADWDSADLMTRRDARELIRRKEMNRDNHRRSGSRSGSVNRGTARDHSVNSRRNRERMKATPVPAPSSRTESVHSGGNSEFVLDCMVVIGNVSNLACVGETTISREKIRNILAILGVEKVE